MTDEPTGLTDAEKLTAIESYVKTLSAMAKELRVKVTADFAARKVERVGAYLPDGTKLGAVGYSGGNRSAKVINDAAALAWCEKTYPTEIVKAVNPAFLKRLLDVAKAGGQPGEPGVDPTTGELLPFIEVTRGAPHVTVTTTSEGVARMDALAHGFSTMLESGR